MHVLDVNRTTQVTVKHLECRPAICLLGAIKARFGGLFLLDEMNIELQFRGCIRGSNELQGPCATAAQNSSTANCQQPEA